MHVRISMSKLHEREDRSMIAHVRNKCVLFLSDIIYSGHYLESLALFLWRVLSPWKLESYVSCVFLDMKGD